MEITEILARGAPHQIFEFYQNIGPDKFRELVEKVDANGDNGLHLATRGNDIVSVYLILLLTRKYNSILLIHSNNQGKTPDALFMERGFTLLINGDLSKGGALKNKLHKIIMQDPEKVFGPAYIKELALIDYTPREIEKTSPPGKGFFTSYNEYCYPLRLAALEQLQKEFNTAQSAYKKIASESEQKLKTLIKTRKESQLENKSALERAQKRLEEIQNNLDANGNPYPVSTIEDIALSIISLGSIKTPKAIDYDVANYERQKAKDNEEAADINFVVDITIEEKKLDEARNKWEKVLDKIYKASHQTKVMIKNSAQDRGYNGVLSAMGKEVNLEKLAISITQQAHQDYQSFHGESKAKAYAIELDNNFRAPPQEQFIARIAGIPGQALQTTANIGRFFSHIRPDVEGEEVGYSAKWGPY